MCSHCTTCILCCSLLKSADFLCLEELEELDTGGETADDNVVNKCSTAPVDGALRKRRRKACGASFQEDGSQENCTLKSVLNGPLDASCDEHLLPLGLDGAKAFSAQEDGFIEHTTAPGDDSSTSTNSSSDALSSSKANHQYITTLEDKDYSGVMAHLASKVEEWSRLIPEVSQISNVMLRKRFAMPYQLLQHQRP